MVRSEGVQDNEAGLITRIIFWLAKRRLGRVPLGLRVRARDPKLFRAHCAHGSVQRFAGHRADAPLKELAQLKVAMMVGCPF